MNLNELYQSRIQQFATEADALKAKYDRLALVRLVTFLIGVAVFFLLFSAGMWYAWGFALVFLVAFARFVMWHFEIQRKAEYFNRLKQINENELKYLSGDISEFESGEEFVDADHPYTVDLDIFGAFSIFQYINRTVTTIGKQTLANYLSQSATKKEILERPNLCDAPHELDARRTYRSRQSKTHRCALYCACDYAHRFIHSGGDYSMEIQMDFLAHSSILSATDNGARRNFT